MKAKKRECLQNSVEALLEKLFSPTSILNYKKLFQYASGELRNWQPCIQNDDGAIDVIDFFSGCGGMSLGFSALSQKVPLYSLKGGVDINEIALQSYSVNFGGNVLNKDIRELCCDEGTHIIRKAFGLSRTKQKPLVVIGCAPCQGFSSHRKKNWHKKDKRNTLIGAFTDIALKLDPDFIVMENVPEILGKKYWKHYEESRNIFIEKGYAVKQTIYNSASFGVPQARFRAIIVASKKDFELPSPVFKDKEFITVRKAIGDLPPVVAGDVCVNDLYHRSAKHKESTIQTISKIPKDGGSRPYGVGPACLDRVNGFYDVYGRLFWDKPAITLTQYARNPASGRFTHPEQNRGLTIREAARLQSFPDAFKFQGSLDECFKQIGESVPPLFSLALATQVLVELSSLKAKSNTVELITEPVSSSYSSVIASIKSNYVSV